MKMSVKCGSQRSMTLYRVSKNCSFLKKFELKSKVGCHFCSFLPSSLAIATAPNLSESEGVEICFKKFWAR